MFTMHNMILLKLGGCAGTCNLGADAPTSQGPALAIRYSKDIIGRERTCDV